MENIEQVSTMLLYISLIFASWWTTNNLLLLSATKLVSLVRAGTLQLGLTVLLIPLHLYTQTGNMCELIRGKS